MMDRQLAIYVSAAQEMDHECELLGQLLADMIPSVRWTIKRTPTSYENSNPDLEALSHSQFYLILMGADIVAPVGVEWMAARKAGLPVFAYHNASAAPTPAGAVFMRDAGITWEDYETAQDFIHHLERELITELLHGTPGYGLHLHDLEELSARLKRLEEREQDRKDDERRGAAGGGVILPTTS